MVAALYDESLDAYLPHSWPAGFGVFRQDYSQMNMTFREHGQVSQSSSRRLARGSEGGSNELPRAAVKHHGRPLGIRIFSRRLRRRARRPGWNDALQPCGADGGARPAPAAPAMEFARRGLAMDAAKAEVTPVAGELAANGAMAKMPAANREQEKQSAGEGVRPSRCRSRFEPGRRAEEPQRNGLLLPASLSDSEGQVKMEFTMPEALHEVEVPRLRPRRPTPRRPLDR